MLEFAVNMQLQAKIWFKWQILAWTNSES